MSNTADIDKLFYEKYTKKMIRNGRLTTLIAALLTFIPALYLWLVLGYKAEWSNILAGWGIIVSSYFFIYIFEPLGFYPSMGLSGIYVGYLAGNIPSVRLPAMLAAREATGTESGTHKGELVGVIAIGMSVFVMLPLLLLRLSPAKLYFRYFLRLLSVPSTTLFRLSSVRLWLSISLRTNCLCHLSSFFA